MAEDKRESQRKVLEAGARVDDARYSKQSGPDLFLGGPPVQIIP